MKSNIKISKYIRDRRGNIKSCVVNNDAEDLNVLEEFSNNLGYTIYLVPIGVRVEFNKDGWLVNAVGEGYTDVWQFVKGWSMPYDCFVNGFPFPLKMNEMWKSDKKVEDINVDELRWNLEYPWWSTDEEKPYNLRPLDVLNDTNRYPLQKKRIEQSELIYPLSLVQTKQNRWLIYDGVHRYIKGLIQGYDVISAQRFNIDDIGDYVFEEDRSRYEEWKNLKYL